MLEFSILDFILTSSLCYMLGVGTGLAICCKWKDHIAIKQTSSQNDLQQFGTNPPPPTAACPTPQFGTYATAMPSAPAMKITYE
jgi:hypothetical protein